MPPIYKAPTTNWQPKQKVTPPTNSTTSNLPKVQTTQQTIKQNETIKPTPSRTLPPKPTEKSETKEIPKVSEVKQIQKSKPIEKIETKEIPNVSEITKEEKQIEKIETKEISQRKSNQINELSNKLLDSFKEMLDNITILSNKTVELEEQNKELQKQINSNPNSDKNYDNILQRLNSLDFKIKNNRK